VLNAAAEPAPGPTSAELEALARRLRPGERVSLGNSIQFTVDRSGRFRFQYKARVGGARSRQISRTLDSYDEALHERMLLLSHRGPGGRSRRILAMRMPLEHYVSSVWWADVLKTTAPLTQLWYRAAWENDIAPFWASVTLGRLCERDQFTDWDSWLHDRKVHRRGPRAGKAAEAAIDKAYNVFFRILQHACDEGYIEANPLLRAKRNRRKVQRLSSRQRSDELRPISPAEVPTVLEVELLRFHLPGRTLHELAIKRSLIDLLAYLLRRLERRELLMCLGREGIDGVVTIYDLNQPAAHVFAFGLALLVEAELARVIAESMDGDSRAIYRHVQGVLGAKHHAVARWKKEADHGEQVDLVSYLTFYEKTRCLTVKSLAKIAAAAKIDDEEAWRQLREVRMCATTSPTTPRTSPTSARSVTG
jgi:hypothetical protein